LPLLLIAAAFGVYWFMFKASDTPEAPKQQAIAVAKHSSAFNNSFDTVMTAYFNLKASFVEADSVKAKAEVALLVAALDKLPTDELKKDTTAVFATITQQISDVKANALSITQQPNITEMRKDFSMVSENMYPLLKAIHYAGNVVYWQNCPMAFGDNGANWISNTKQIVNPYMGKNHPEYKGTMLGCGEVLDSIR
jgi:hypothetical protein